MRIDSDAILRDKANGFRNQVVEGSVAIKTGGA